MYLYLHFAVHHECVTEWLQKHCTCPICRYELPTNNPIYEAARKERMKMRKPRFAQYELERMKISELIDLCRNKIGMAENISGNGYTKEEVIDLIVKSGKVDIIASPPPMELKNVGILRGMGVGKLKRTMLEAGVFFDSRDVIEKEDMVQIFINSGRVVFEEEDEYGKEETAERNEEDKEDKKYDEQGDNRFYGRQDEVKRARLDEDGSSCSRPGSGSDSQHKLDDDLVEDSSIKSSSDQQSLNNDAINLFPPEDEAIELETAMSIDAEHPDSIGGEQSASGSALATSTTTPPAAAASSATSYSFYESADISTRSVGELRQLGRALGVDLSNCLEKREMIQRIVTTMTRNGSGVRFGGGVL